MSDLFFAKDNQTLSLLTAATNLDPSVTAPTTYRIISDRRFHILIDKTANDATVTDWYVPAECAETFYINPGDTISVIKAAGETDGTVWVSAQ